MKKYTAADGAETWRVRFRQQGRSRSKTCTDRAGAEYFAKLIHEFGPERALALVNESTDMRLQNTGPTVTECVERYISTRPNPATRAAYTLWLNKHIKPSLGDTRINRLTHEDVKVWVNNQDDLAPNTILRNHTLLSGALTEAVDRKEIDANPARKVRIPRRTRARNEKRGALMPPLTRDEYALIHKSVATPGYQVMVEFLAETGCRFGEAAALTPADVNLDTGTVRFRNSYSYQEDVKGYVIGPTKTAESERVVAVKQSILEKLNLTGEYVFTNQEGLPVKNNTFRTGPWRNALKRSGLPEHRWPHPHDMRHAHVCWLLDAGIPLPAIQKRVGHADVRTTLSMYSHAAANSDEKILAALDCITV